MIECLTEGFRVRAGSTVFAMTIVAIVFFADRVNAQYLFDSQDPRIAQEKLIYDMQKGQVDHRNLGTSAENTLKQLSGGSFSFPFLVELGDLRKVCPTVITRSQNGSKYAFRAVHERGSADWVITTSSRPETVQNLVFLKGPTGGGPPAVLQPYTPGGDDKLLPSIELDCRTAFSEAPSPAELQQTCKRYPDMCKPIR
jgi:hypothetical protein